MEGTGIYIKCTRVLSVSLLPVSPSRLGAGPLAIVTRLMPFFALLNGVQYFSRLVICLQFRHLIL